MHRMDRLRRSLRESFRRKKDHGPESSKPHQWQADEEAVKAGNCTFHVKYLGCVEVFESRGMQVCEEAMKVLRGSRRRPVKANLYVSGDGLRVVEDDTKGLIVDQTIEKVSFCAPDRNHERGFSYICRDGTTRRWMCHGFLSSKDSGERLSHAVGCAFAVCLERKQRREKECGVTMSYDSKTSTFTRSGSFRVTPMTEINNKVLNSPDSAINSNPLTARPQAPPTHAIERPHAPTKMLERQGSFRGFAQLSNQSPFKRQLSLRLNELPSNLQRTQQNAINIFGTPNGNASIPPPVSESPAPPPRSRNRLQSLPNSSLTSTSIAEVSSSNTSSELNLGPKVENNKDLVSELCQQVSQGLSLLAANHDDSASHKQTNGVLSISNKFPTKFTNPWDEEVGSVPNSSLPIFNTSALGTANTVIKTNNSEIISSSAKAAAADIWTNNLTQSHEPKAPMQPKITPIKENIPLRNPTFAGSNITTPQKNVFVDSSTKTSDTVTNPSDQVSSGPLMNNASKMSDNPARPPYRSIPPRSQSLGSDPFDASWATPLTSKPTNPFARQQTFQISM